MDNTLSTLIHVKNSKLYIEACLQSWYDLSDEIVVINNGSTDGSIDIARSFDKVRVIDDFRKWTDVGEHIVRNDALRHCNGEFIAIPDSDEILFEGQVDRLWEYLKDQSVGSWRLRKVEFYGDHYHIQDQYRGPQLDGEGEEVPGFGRQVIHGHPYIYRNHPGLRYIEHTGMLYGLHSSIVGTTNPPRIMWCDDIRVAHYGNCMPNESIYNKTIFYYNGVADPNDMCRSEEYQAQIDPNNPLGFHPDQAVRPYFGKPPIYMADHPERFHRIKTSIDDQGKARIVERSDTPLEVEIKIGTPQDCGRTECDYRKPVIDVDLKRKANEFTIIKALDYYTPTAELCMIHPNVFVMLNENVPFNPQFSDEVKERIYGAIHKNARHFLAASTSVKDCLTTEGVDPSRITVVNFWGCDTSFWKPLNYDEHNMRLVKRSFGCKTESHIVLFAGRMEEHKGIRYLLEAAGILDDPQIEVILVGEGNYIPFCGYINANSSTRVHYLGRVDRDVLLTLYNISTALVLPSLPTPTWVEQFGRVLTEAMACGTPCIATRFGGPVDIIEDGVSGYLVNSHDAQAIAGRIRDIVGSDDIRHSMSSASIERVSKKFSDDRSREIIQRCIEENMWK